MLKTIVEQLKSKLMGLRSRVADLEESLDDKGNSITVNQALLDIMGHEKDEVVSRNFKGFLHLDYIANFEKNFPKFKAVGEILRVEFEMTKKRG